MPIFQLVTAYPANKPTAERINRRNSRCLLEKDVNFGFSFIVSSNKLRAWHNVRARYGSHLRFWRRCLSHDIGMQPPKIRSSHDRKRLHP